VSTRPRLGSADLVGTKPLVRWVVGKVARHFERQRLLRPRRFLENEAAAVVELEADVGTSRSTMDRTGPNTLWRNHSTSSPMPCREYEHPFRPTEGKSREAQDIPFLGTQTHSLTIIKSPGVAPGGNLLASCARGGAWEGSLLTSHTHIENVEHRGLHVVGMSG
jgi:hypothetical protein